MTDMRQITRANKHAYSALDDRARRIASSLEREVADLDVERAVAAEAAIQSFTSTRVQRRDARSDTITVHDFDALSITATTNLAFDDDAALSDCTSSKAVALVPIASVADGPASSSSL